MATGNSKSAKSARVKLQLRDKKGRWIEMGGGVKWYSPNLGKFMFGTVLDATPDGKAVVEVKGANSSAGNKPLVVNIVPSQLEKVKAKASLAPNTNDVIKPAPVAETKATPVVDKDNIIFKNMHKNGVFHDEPFGPDYEAIPFDPKGTNNLQKNDLVTYYAEGTQKKGHVIGTDKKSGEPIIQPEVSSSWGFGGHGSVTKLDNIVNVYKPVASSPSDAGSDKETKADIPVPSPETVPQGGFGSTPAKPEKTEQQLADEAKAAELKKAIAKEQAGANTATAIEKAKKLDALVSTPVGTRLLSADEKTINLVKQDAGYWTEEGTGTNYTSTQVAEKFAGEKGVSMIQPPATPNAPGTLSAYMTSEEFKQNVPNDVKEQLADTKIVAAYTVPDAPYMFTGYNQVEVDALGEYVGDSSFINQALRTNNSDVKSNQEYIAALDQILDKSPLVEATTVWRGIRANPTVFAALENKGIYHDKAFSSTSSNEKVARDWIKGASSWSEKKSVTLEIKLPTGFKAHKIDYSIDQATGFSGLSSYEEEEEVILPRNTAYKVVSLKQNENNTGYTAVVEPVLTDHNSIKGTTNGGNTTNAGDSGSTGGSTSSESTSDTSNGSSGTSEEVHSGVGGPNDSNGGTSPSASEGTEPEPGTESGTDNQTGPIAEVPVEEQVLGKLYTDATGQYMAGANGEKFRMGDTVSYTKKGKTEEGKIVALYEGVASARVQFPDGTKSVKKINTLKSLETTPEADIAPVQEESVPVAETPVVSKTIEVPKTDADFAVSSETHNQAAFDNNLSIAVADIPVGSILKLKVNPAFALKKIGPNDWRSSYAPDTQATDSSVAMAMDMSHNGKSSYDIHMPKTTTAPEAAPEADATTQPLLNGEEGYSAVDGHGLKAPVAKEEKTVTDNFVVTSNEKNSAGTFHVKTKDGSKISVGVDSLKEGDKVYPVGTQTKPYATHGNYGTKEAFINATHPAGIGTVIKNDPNKPYVQVMGEDENKYFPSKNFVATKQSDEIDALIKDASTDPAFASANEEAIEEVAAPEELAAMESVGSEPAGPIDVSSWKKLKASSGSNPGGEYEAPDGSHYFIKQSKSDLHAKNEVLASDIYQAAGINSLELGYSDVDGSGKLGTIAPMLTGAKDNFENALANDQYRKEFQKGWAVDAWLGNWDVVGLAFDNALTDENGKAIRVDPGGALLFRAMGSPKTDAQFSNSVTEWDSMRTDTNNYQAHKAFGDMSIDQIKESVAIVASFTDAKIDDLVDKHDFDQPTADKLKDRLKNRRNDLISRANALGGTPIEQPLAQWEIELLNGGKDDEYSFGTATEDEVFDSMDEEITNEDISPSPSVVVSPQFQEALDALKKKLQGEETPEFKKEEPLADWEKELLEGAEAEAKAAVEEPKADPLLQKPGTVYQLANGQDAVVGKYNTEISYGVNVDYFKKGEKKSGIVSHMMVNQQSAKVLWSDGSSTIIKGSQLVGKGKDSGTTTKATPFTSTITEELPATTSPFTTSQGTPTNWVMEKWGALNGAEAADYPTGTVLNWQNDQKTPSESGGWIKIAPNTWKSMSLSGMEYPDSEIDESKDGTYVMYVPAYNKDMSVTEDVEVDLSKPSTSMIWNQQGGDITNFPIGTKLSANDDSDWSYTKTAINTWKYGKSEDTYSDGDTTFLSKNNTLIELPEGFEFFEPHIKSAADYPVNTTLNKSIEIRKIDESTWTTKAGIDYSNGELDNLSMSSSWIVKTNNTDKDFEEPESKLSLFDEIEQANGIFEKTYTHYQESVGEENSNWDTFSDEFSEYLPDDEKNWVEINNQKFFIVPMYSTGPTMEVAIQDEFGQTHATVAANSGYNNYDSYYLNTQLDKAFSKLKEEYETKTPPSVVEEPEFWKDSTENANDLPLGTQIIGTSKVFEKTETNTWKSLNSGGEYSDDVMDSLKAPGNATNWKIKVNFAADEPVVPKSEDDSITKEWSNDEPSAEDMPLGSQILSGTGAGKIVFQKFAQNEWSPVDNPSLVQHSNETMNSLKTGAWQIKAVSSAFEKPEPVEVPALSANDLASKFLAFHSDFNEYFKKLSVTPWAQFKGEELEFELDGQKFIFAPHPMSTYYAPYMNLKTAEGTNVFSQNDFEINDNAPDKFEASDVFNAAQNYLDIVKGTKDAPQATSVEFNHAAGTTLAKIDYSDFAVLPVGTKINYLTNGKVYGTYMKNSNHTWRFQDANKEKPSHKSETNSDFKYFIENNKEAAANYVLVAPEAPKPAEDEVIEQTEKPKFTLKHHKVESAEELTNYPVNTVVKMETSSYNNTYQAVYYVKTAEGNWDKYVKTANTVSKKNTISNDGLFSTVSGWSKYPVAVSIPTDDGVLLGSGEHAYVGDLVLTNNSGNVYTIEKINKTALNLIDSSGNKIKVPAKKLYKDSDFGVKDPNANNGANASASKYDVSTTNPITAFVEAQKAEEAIKNQLLNFAGASAADYDAKGLGLPVSPDVFSPKNLGLSVIPVEPGNVNSPLFGQPKPTMPESPEDYPSFDESVLDGLPKWDSAEWLKKVEERYLANPNKKFANVQKSTQWNKIEEVLKGNDGYKSYLNALLNNKYVDQELFDMAEKAIKAQEVVNKPLKKAHQENVAKEKAEYEAKKAEYLAEYNGKVKQYQSDLEEWSKVNVNAGAIKKLPKLPELVNNPFTGGPADWTKSYPGTYPVQTIMNTMRDDNVLGRYGLAAVVDSDRIEENSVVFNKIRDMNGVEKFEVKFKVTHAYGKLLNNKFKADPAISASQGIYYPRKTNMIGKPDDELAKLAGKPSESSFINSGKRYEFIDSASGGKVVFQHAEQSGQNISVNHNSVQLLLDVNATPADFQLALENLGIDAKPSTPGALRVVAENKLLTMYSGESNWGDENFSGEKREKALKKIKDKFNLTVDDVVVETDAWGRTKFFISDAKTKELVSKSGIKEFTHSVYAGEDLDVWESILSGANPGLAANYFRGQHGIGVLKSGTGMSPDKDMSIGSGAGIFITANSSKNTSAPYYNTVGVSPEALFRRLDSWANSGDNYGKNDKGSSTPGQLMQGSNFHELIVRDGIPVSDFRWVTIGSEQAKKQLIERLTAKGIFMINGVALENFILTNNQAIPEVPLLNTPGSGIPASGPAV